MIFNCLGVKSCFFPPLFFKSADGSKSVLGRSCEAGEVLPPRLFLCIFFRGNVVRKCALSLVWESRLRLGRHVLVFRNNFFLERRKSLPSGSSQTSSAASLAAAPYRFPLQRGLRAGHSRRVGPDREPLTLKCQNIRLRWRNFVVLLPEEDWKLVV